MTKHKNDVITLQSALALLEEGWTQKHFVDAEDGNAVYCAEGALIEASGVIGTIYDDYCDTEDLDDVRRYLALAIDPEARRTKSDCRIIRDFNDHRKTKKAHVVEVFMKAIQLAMASEPKKSKRGAKKKSKKKQ